MNEPIVTVIVPTYGRANNLKRALQSVLNQSYKNIEIIVIDDNNPETEERKKTIDIMQNTEFSDIKYIQHKHNKNGAAARNTGISIAKGKYIAFLDDDDEFESKKIEEQVLYLNNNIEFDACYCKSNYFIDGKNVYKTVFDKVGDITKDILSLKSEYNSSTLMFTSKSLKDINGFDESFIRNQDYEIMIRFLRKYKIGIVKEYLVKIHTEDQLNQPSFSKYEEIRLRFIKTFKEDIEKLSLKDQNNINRELFFDLAYYALRKKDLMNFLKYLVKSKPNIELIKSNLNKIKKVFKKKFNL